jgi:ribonuclease HI
MSKKVICFTDGACSGNPGYGGYGIVVCDDSFQIIKKISQGVENTTNNRMELQAVITAIELAKRNNYDEIEIFTDSAYVVNAINQKWIATWIMRGWKTIKNEEVKNRDLWEKLISVTPGIKYHFTKVKGHSSNKLNDLADDLAVAGSKIAELKHSEA